jgi:hypothetical protein
MIDINLARLNMSGIYPLASTFEVTLDMDYFLYVTSQGDPCEVASKQIGYGNLVDRLRVSIRLVTVISLPPPPSRATPNPPKRRGKGKRRMSSGYILLFLISISTSLVNGQFRKILHHSLGTFETILYLCNMMT